MYIVMTVHFENITESYNELSRFIYIGDFRICLKKKKTLNTNILYAHSQRHTMGDIPTVDEGWNKKSVKFQT